MGFRVLFLFVIFLGFFSLTIACSPDVVCENDSQCSSGFHCISGECKKSSLDEKSIEKTGREKVTFFEKKHEVLTQEHFTFDASSEKNVDESLMPDVPNEVINDVISENHLEMIKTESSEPEEAQNENKPDKKCINVCQNGAIRCLKNSTQTCVIAVTGCTIWAKAVFCGKNRTCKSGKCVLACKNACKIKDVQCLNNGVQKCVMMTTGCTGWTKAVACGKNRTCKSGKCVLACKNACKIKDVQCLNNGVQKCVMMTTGCTGWTKAVACGKNQTCKSGKCVPTSIGMGKNVNIIFLHHSTGRNIWNGGVSQYIKKYNVSNKTNYQIKEQYFPKSSPYGWKNYPYDYWNIWVKNAGKIPYKTEPTLEILTKSYQVIIWKHCFPVSNVQADTGKPSISSSRKSLENYKLQYAALKAQMHKFPSIRFIVWTGAALVKGNSSSLKRAKAFFDWVKGTWDTKGDNIFVWDFWELETEGGISLLKKYAMSSSDSHPNATFAKMVTPYFGKRITDVIEGRGDTGSLTGK